MKQFFFLCMTCFALGISSPVFSADENKGMKEEDGSSSMSIDNIIASCEKQYTAEMYPDTEERNKHIDQCIEDNSPDIK